MPATCRPLTIALALALALAAPLPVAANGVLYFVTGPVTIVGADGKARPAKKGDRVTPRERVVTGANAMAQLKMADGSFVGVRPDSELRVQAFRPTGADAGAVLVLDKGSVRVLNLETDPKTRPLPVQLQAGDGAAVVLRAGDLESGKPGGAFVNRLNAGTAAAQTNRGNLPLAVHSVNTVTPTAIAPASIAALPPISIAAAGSPGRAATAPAAIATLPPTAGPSAIATSSPNLLGVRQVLPPSLAQAVVAPTTNTFTSPPISSSQVVGTILQAADTQFSKTGSTLTAAQSSSLSTGTQTFNLGGQQAQILVKQPTTTSTLTTSTTVNRFNQICFAGRC
jgi:hypothetical protein